MSPRAACRLETFGFREVYDYAPGKAAWLAENLPWEGERRPDQRVSHYASRSVATSSPTTPVERVRARLSDLDSGGHAVVLAPDGLLLGVASADSMGGGSSGPVSAVMDRDPPTLRPDADVAQLRRHFRDSGGGFIELTTVSGHWVGTITAGALAPG